MAERFTERLRRRVEPIWEAQHQHPFVRGVGAGTLELERFQVWVRQDYLFLIDYGRLLALAAARSPDLETMTRFAELLAATLQTEMGLHRSCNTGWWLPVGLRGDRPASDPAAAAG